MLCDPSDHDVSARLQTVARRNGWQLTLLAASSAPARIRDN